MATTTAGTEKDERRVKIDEVAGRWADVAQIEDFIPAYVKPRVLDMCSGPSGGIKQLCTELGYECFSIDIQPFPHVDLVIDILDFDVNMLPWVPTHTFASPPCPTYSWGTHKHRGSDFVPWTDDARTADAIVLKIRAIIAELTKVNEALLYYIENPRGRLRHMDLLQGLPRRTVVYCRYGTHYVKATDWWTNDDDWRSRPGWCPHPPHHPGYVPTDMFATVPRELLEEIFTSWRPVKNTDALHRRPTTHDHAPTVIDVLKSVGADDAAVGAVSAVEEYEPSAETARVAEALVGALGPDDDELDDDGGRRYKKRFGDEDLELPDEAWRAANTVRLARQHVVAFGAGGDMIVDVPDGPAVLELVPRPIPRHILQKLNGPEGPLWRAALAKEVESLKKNKVYSVGWTEADVRACGGKILSTLFNFSIKRSGKHKVRWCMDGSRQTPDTYDFATSTAASMSTFMTFMAVAAARGHKVVTADFSTAFLNAELGEHEHLFARIPIGLGLEDEGKLVKLHRCWYGLVQASRGWQLHLERDLLADGWVQDVKERGLYRKRVAEGDGPDAWVFCMVYVDDLLCSAVTDEVAWRALSGVLDKYDHTKGDDDEFLGIQFEQRDDGIVLHLANTILAAAEQFGVLDVKGVATPVFKKTPTEEDCPADGSPEQRAMRKRPYLSLLGVLRWIVETVRGEALYHINYLAKFSANPGEAHWQAAIHILTYLKTTAYRGLHFKRGGSLQVYGMSDSDWGGAEQNKSVTGVVCMLAGAAVLRASARQKSVSQSTFEAELVGAGNLAKCLLAFRDMLKFFREPQGPSNLFVDNETAEKFLKTVQYNGRTRHIAGRYWLVDTEVQAKRLAVKWLRGTDNCSDMFTKNVTAALAEKHIAKMGYVDLAVAH